MLGCELDYARSHLGMAWDLVLLWLRYVHGALLFGYRHMPYWVNGRNTVQGKSDL